MEQTHPAAMEETGNTPGDMPLNAGDAGYGSVPGPGLTGSVGGSESAPLLIPEDAPEPGQRWRPMTKEELERAAGGPGWRKVRCYLVLVFWLTWVAMLATSIAIIVMSPRPVATELRWWQKTLFYQVQPELFLERQTGGSEGISALCEQIPYMKSLGIGALILEGLFDKEAPPLNLTAVPGLGTLPQIQHLIAESNKAGLKVLLDFCEVEPIGLQDVAANANRPSNLSDIDHHGVLFWLQQGVAGFAICDTDAAYSEKTLLEWRVIFKRFNSQEEERIVVVKQTRDVLPPLNNATLVDVVMRSILPSSSDLLPSKEVAEAVEKHLQSREEDIWPSWTIGGKASPDLKKLLLVLTMTLPGSPTVQYDEELDQRKNVSLRVRTSPDERNTPSDDHTGKEKKKRSAVALFTSLSHSRAREEALLFGSFTFLPYNSSINASSSSNSPDSPPSAPVLAFLRSWGCVHFLVLLNIGPEPHILNPSWAPSLPKAGVFVTSTEMDRLGTVVLETLELQPHEAIVIKLFEAGSYS